MCLSTVLCIYEYDNHYQLKSKKYMPVSVFGFIAGLANAI